MFIRYNEANRTALRYSNNKRFAIGYHATDKSIFNKIIANKEKLKVSKKNYNWLGDGIYFWENSYIRAVDWGEECKKSEYSDVKSPKVIGAVIELDNCFDLTDAQNVRTLKSIDKYLIEDARNADKPLPINNAGKDKNLMYRDCAIIRYFDNIIKNSKIEPFSTLRGAFPEGKPICNDSHFRMGNHIQICVKDPKKIMKYFIPQQEKKIEFLCHKNSFFNS